MWQRWFLVVIVTILGLGAGCQKGSTPGPSGVPVDGPTRAQPKLPIIKLWLGAEEVEAEVARSPVQLQTGMMFRKEMAENEGMLFVFPEPQQAKFYMRNTFLPLTCAYIDSDGTILEIHDMKPLDETTIEAATDQVQYVLEMRQGWFDRHKINTGTAIRSQNGSLRQLFFPGSR